MKLGWMMAGAVLLQLLIWGFVGYLAWLLACARISRLVTDHPDSAKRRILSGGSRGGKSTGETWEQLVDRLHAELAAERERYAKLEAENELMRAVITLCPECRSRAK